LKKSLHILKKPWIFIQGFFIIAPQFYGYYVLFNYFIMEISLKRHCCECGSVIRGRSDKKFCGDSCRTQHHNRQNASTHRQVRLINNILKRNRRILEQLVPAGVKTIQSALLLASGFDFGYHTRAEKTPSEEYRYYCYEFAYEPLNQHQWLIVRTDGTLGLLSSEDTAIVA
jgi:hypothetical protein